MKNSKRTARATAAIFTIFLLAGCGEETIDGSSAAKLTNSLNNISQNTSIEKKESLDNAINIIKTRYKSLENLSKAIDGMNADEIIEKGANTEKELKSIELRQLQKYKENSINNYKAIISSAQNQLLEDQKKPTNLAEFLKERREKKIELAKEGMEKIESMSPEEFEVYAKNKGWQPDFSKI